MISIRSASTPPDARRPRGASSRTGKLRGSYGTAFRSPSFLDLYGRSAYYVGNPDLNPERARGQDFGLDYSLPGEARHSGRHLVRHPVPRFSSSTTSRSRRARWQMSSAPARGASRSPRRSRRSASRPEWGLSYTYLEAENSGTGARLLRRPRHSGNIDLWHDFGSGFSAGVGGRVVAQREDVDARTFRTIDGEDYTVIRVYAAWQATKSLAVKARSRTPSMRSTRK